MNNNESSIQEKRKFLCELSAPFRNLVKLGALDTVNSGLIDLYKKENPEISCFNTFNQWKKEGKSILKGSKAFLVWGSPKEKEQGETNEQSSEEEKAMKFYPICFLFSNLQVK